MDFQNIIWQREGNIGVITLNRPKSLNALSAPLFQELETLITDISKDESIGAFIVTGSPRPDGRPCFSAGADLKQPPPPEPRSTEQIVFDTLYAMSTRKNATGLAGSAVALDDLGRIPKISIAAIDGVCTAGGLELALGCDIILVAETAQISDLHLRNLGLIGGAASCTRLARRVGVSKAIELCCTCDIIDGREAHRIGFANQVFPPGKLMDGAKEMARKIASMRPVSVAMVKATCNAVYDMDYNMSYRYADACSMALHFGEKEWQEKRQKESQK
jgi:enoyl-CoA hydratase/carnithine racemase